MYVSFFSPNLLSCWFKSDSLQVASGLKSLDENVWAPPMTYYSIILPFYPHVPDIIRGLYRDPQRWYPIPISFPSCWAFLMGVVWEPWGNRVPSLGVAINSPIFTRFPIINIYIYSITFIKSFYIHQMIVCFNIPMYDHVLTTCWIPI